MLRKVWDIVQANGMVARLVCCIKDDNVKESSPFNEGNSETTLGSQDFLVKCRKNLLIYVGSNHRIFSHRSWEIFR